MQGRKIEERELLKAVSRSFYLSLRLLPGPMREPLSLGYLLARASDTLADTAAVAVAQRAELLTEFGEVVAGTRAVGDFQERLLRDFVPQQRDAGEARLLGGVTALVDWLEEQPVEIAAAIREVLATIVAGQRWDLEFFAGGGVRVVDAAALEKYTYQVAGCVGAFWTRIGFATMGEKFARGGEAELTRLGVSYGCGLQLVNILRDVERDRQLGRCYLPVDAAGDADALVRVRRGWIERARVCLADGLSYAAQVSSRRVRTATVLPALLGMETLDKLARASTAELAVGVKIGRGEVYASLWQAMIFRQRGR
jgi:farnesyl-diphosphate farnesyltransferase